jgi:hypothetical protein
MSNSQDNDQVNSSNKRTNEVNLMSELFVELNDEQQELVSGGASLTDNIDSYYDLEKLATASIVTNGANGSSVITATETLDISSNIFRDFDVSV